MSDRYWVGGGSSTAWNATGNTNWSATSGGANNASVPAAADNAIFDGIGTNARGNCSINGAQTAALLLMLPAYNGTWNLNNAGPLTVNGNVTFSINMSFGGSTTALTIGAASTITMNGKIWPGAVNLGAANKIFADAFTHNGTVTITAAQTITLNGQMTCNIIQTPNANLVWAGTLGWICNTYGMNNVISAVTQSFTEGLTYRCRDNFTGVSSTSSAKLSLVSTSATNKSNITLDHDCLCSLMANVTRIDASGGRPINTWNGTVTTCINVNPYTDLKTVAATF